MLAESSPADSAGTYYWATHNGAEIDLLLIKDGQMIGVECKRLDAPRLTPSMKIALHDLRLERILVIYPGSQRYKIADRIIAVPFEQVIRGKSKSLVSKS